MPTYDKTDTFKKDWVALDAPDKQRFKVAVKAFVEDLSAVDHGFRPGLRVRGVKSADGVFEMTWAPDGRATFQYGPELIAGEPHVIWRRIGTHDVFRKP